MLVLAAGILIILTGFAVLAIDVGRIYVVRNEMQNVADAAVLAGANCLNRQSRPGSTTECKRDTQATLNWDRAIAKATNQLSRNTADNRAISSTDSGHQIEVGYWNVNGGTTLQPISLSPLGPCTVVGGVMITACDKPAIRVTITKDIGKNNGPITMLTRVMFGGSDVPMTAKAVAVISSPGNVLPGSLIPQAINKCMFDKYWDSVTNSPKTATTSTLTYQDKNGNKTYSIPQTIGQPWQIRIGSSYHYDTCDAGQWTSFKQDVNNTPTVIDLINNGNPDSLGIGENTWIEPGTAATLYDTLADKYPVLPADVTVVVVDQSSDLSKGPAPIVAFAGFRIDVIKGSSGQNPKFYIEGHFTKGVTTSGSSGIGPYYGTYTPPRLAQ